ncbi:hypothetical protein CBR_g32721 [Chara braunii]|uniref:Uncharacterized protein n=1 Tax=Chara braunii TaxID=69332 RepID=A0A388LHD5_CHABU|nr:hypothetical protein CBR_g32721 [Chara braunii]|eukprot:GBG81729.1 hypothetical protein CBR_g32721 [Chara braunii]
MEGYLLLLTGMAEVRLRVWERKGPGVDTSEVMKEIKMLPAKDFTLSVHYIRTTLPDFIVEEVFFGQERVEMADEAALRVPDRGYKEQVKCKVVRQAENSLSKRNRLTTIKTKISSKDKDTGKDRVEVGAEEEEMVKEEEGMSKVEEDLEEEDMADKEEAGAIKEALRAAMTRKGGVAGPSRPASGRERRQGSQRVTRDTDGMPIYKKGDNLRLFLREFEDHAFRREWDIPTMLLKVNGVGECQLKIEEITTDCLGWITFKTEMWTEYGDLRSNEIEEDIIFDGTNMEDFEESIALCAEMKGWKEEEKLEQMTVSGSLLEGGAEVAEKFEGAGRSQRGNDKDGKVEASIRELQERVIEKEELLTQGVASHIPEILREIQRLRKREESRDAQVEKMGKEVESMSAEMNKVREEQQELKKQVESLNIALGSKNKEVEKERVERQKLEKEVGKLEGRVNNQEKEMEALKKVSQEGAA